MLGTMTILRLPAVPSGGNLGPTPPAQVVEEPKDVKMAENEEKFPMSVARHTRTIGIIYPPPGIRNIVDKTAKFVADKGQEFEKRLILDYSGNAKFWFLNASDPYHAYYQHRLAEARAQTPPADSADIVVAAAADGAEASVKPDPSRFRKVLEPAEAEQYTVRLPEGITSEELHIIKLTAQFVARNGKSFLTGLTSRESNNPQFHFLKPTHSMFTLFTSLADAYSKVLMPTEGLTDELWKSASDMTTVLERCLHRLEWDRSQEQARQIAEDEIERERLQMAMIDWHDFVVVETIEFADDGDQHLPPPMTVEEVIRRSKIPTLEAEEYVEPGLEVELEMDEEEVQFVKEGMSAAASVEEDGDFKNAETVVFPEEQDPPMRIVVNWKRPEERIPVVRDPTKYVVSPITGELIPINEMSEHMRISLIDPKYKEQKERMFAKIMETTLAHDDEISRNIVGLARTRPDIFGTTEEEVSDAVKAEIEKTKEEPKQVIWDGLTGSIGHTTPVPQIPSEQNVMVNHPPMPMMSHNLPVPPPPGSQFMPLGAPQRFVPLPIPQPKMPIVLPPPMPQGILPPPPAEEAPPLPEEPEPKRQKLDESVLIPEVQFLAQHSGPARINVSVLNTNEENLKGQVLEISVQSLSETIGSLKEKISGEIQTNRS